MERRVFLKSGITAGIGVACPGVLFLASPASAAGAGSDADDLRAAMIWCADPVCTTLRKNGQVDAVSACSADPESSPGLDQHAVFVKEFTLAARPQAASMHIFAYTRYRLYVNGIYCGRGPSRFENQRPEYDTREIASALKPGKNIVAVLVHCDAPTGRIMRHKPGLATEICIRGKSGALRIATDTSWRARPDLSFGPRNGAWASIEEHIDARNCIDFRNAELAVADWPLAVPTGGPEFFPVWPRTTALQQEQTREWTEKNIHFPLELGPGDELQLSLPEIAQAYHKLEFDGEEGSVVEASYLLPEESQCGHCTYIARTGVQTWMGGDTFAFNRLSVRVVTGRIRLRSAQAIEVRYPFTRVASFECSDPPFNRLWKICARSLELLSEDSYVDCADRERVEWTDNTPPAFDCTRVMMRGPDADGVQYWGDNRLLKALLRRISLTQKPDGQMKAHSCSERWDIHAIMEDRSCDWVVQLREYFESSGDHALVRELWPALTRLIQWFLDRRTSRGLVLARDWEVWDNPLRYQVCEATGLNALVYRALADAAWLGTQIGETAAASSYAACASKLMEDFNRELWNEQEQVYDGALFGPGSKMNKQLNGPVFAGPIVNGRYKPTAQATLFALYCGIVPAPRLELVRTWLKGHLDQITDIMSYYYLFDALYKMQKPEFDSEVLSLIRNGWKLQVESPWQTTWEGLKGGSKAHIYGMAPGFFLTAYVLGAHRRGPVTDRTIVIEPRCGDLRWAHGTAVTEFGPVEVEWTVTEDRTISLTCFCPPSCITLVRLYHRGDGAQLSVDGAGCTTKHNGEFLEVQLPPGKHTVRL